MALCYLLKQYCKKSENRITAFIIDHQLRKESTKEAFQVSNALSKLGKVMTVKKQKCFLRLDFTHKILFIHLLMHFRD